MQSGVFDPSDRSAVQANHNILKRFALDCNILESSGLECVLGLLSSQSSTVYVLFPQNQVPGNHQYPNAFERIVHTLMMVKYITRFRFCVSISV